MPTAKYGGLQGSPTRSNADPVGAYRAAAADLLDAFNVDGVLEATFALPEFGPDATVPGAMAIGFHFVDYVVHGWDVARSIGVPFALPTDVVRAVLPVALGVPDGDFRAADGSPIRAGSDTRRRGRVTSIACFAISVARPTGRWIRLRNLLVGDLTVDSECLRSGRTRPDTVRLHAGSPSETALRLLANSTGERVSEVR